MASSSRGASRIAGGAVLHYVLKNITLRRYGVSAPSELSVAQAVGFNRRCGKSHYRWYGKDNRYPDPIGYSYD